MKRSFGKLAGLLLIVRRSLRQHLLSTVVTVIALGIGTGLVAGVFVLADRSEAAFTGGEVGFDAVLGARGSELQLVLNSVFHLETSPGNIPWALYEEVKGYAGVHLAIPYAVGDNYLGYRIVGTTGEIFTEATWSAGEPFKLRADSRAFDPTRFEAVLGSAAAAATGLNVGDVFQPYHGLDFDPEATDTQHEERCLVVGVLEPTGTPADRVIWVPIEATFRIEGHELRGSGENYTAQRGREIPDEHKEVSAVMLRLSRGVAKRLDQVINRQGKEATLAWPLARPLAEFFSKLGWLTRILKVIAWLVVVTGAATVLASLSNAMNERRREFAIFRLLGAHRGTVFAVILLEAVALAFLGVLCGAVFYAGLSGVAFTVVRAQTGVFIDPWTWHPTFLLVPLGVLTLGALAGVLPAWRAYRTDVARNLS